MLFGSKSFYISSGIDRGFAGKGCGTYTTSPAPKIWFFLNLGRSSAFGQKAPFMDNSGIKGLF
jgi:hypothetical protein